MPLFRGSKNATIVNGEIVATAQDIADAVNDAIAAKNAAEAAEAGAQTAETNAETAETNAETAETNAETAESGAVDAQSYAEEWANKPEDSLVSTDAGGDGVDDFSALHHANKASDSASAASTSESNALTSEQNAQQAATDAETALDTFTDQYLGAKSSDPTTDNDGDPLQDGALYFNNTDGNLRIYSDSLSDWIVVDVRSDSNIRNLFSAGGDLTYNSTTGEFSVTTYKSGDFDTDFDTKDTDDLSEGTANLYYTDSRVRGAVSASGDLSYDSATGEFSFTERTDSEVQNLFSAAGDLSYNSSTGEFSVTTYKSSDFDSDFSGKSTDDLTEGTGNLYYTDTRARNAVSASGSLTYDAATGVFDATLDSSDVGLQNVTNDLQLKQALNLSDLASPSSARDNLGLGTAATTDSSDYATAAQGVKADDALPSTGGTMTGPITLLETKETVVSLSGTTPTVDLSLGTVFTLTTSGNTTFTFSNPATSGLSSAFSLEVTAGGSHTLTWPSSVAFAGGTAPDAPDSGETDVFTFFTTDGGTTWYGFQAGDDLA